jgi:uncharacterized membrane protein YphA (DoxX/SURF4 family)
MSIAGNTTGQIDKSRLIFPGLAGLYESVAPYSYSIIRFVAGAILVYHGYGKLFGGIIQGVADHVVTPLGLPMPLAFAYFLGILECFGGAALAIGFLTRPIALMLTVEFLIITFWHYPTATASRARRVASNIRWCCWCSTRRSSSAAADDCQSIGCSAESFDAGIAEELRSRRYILLTRVDQNKTSAVR